MLSRHEQWKQAMESDRAVRRARRKLDRAEAKVEKAEMQLGRATLAVNRRFKNSEIFDA